MDLMCDILIKNKTFKKKNVHLYVFEDLNIIFLLVEFMFN